MKRIRLNEMTVKTFTICFSSAIRELSHQQRKIFERILKNVELTELMGADVAAVERKLNSISKPNHLSNAKVNCFRMINEFRSLIIRARSENGRVILMPEQLLCNKME